MQELKTFDLNHIDVRELKYHLDKTIIHRKVWKKIKLKDHTLMNGTTGYLYNLMFMERKCHKIRGSKASRQACG